MIYAGRLVLNRVGCDLSSFLLLGFFQEWIFMETSYLILLGSPIVVGVL